MTRAQRLTNVFWPAFIAAGVATVVFFTMFDPMELQILGHHVDVGRTAAYSVGFFGLLDVRRIVVGAHVLFPADRRGGQPLPAAADRAAAGMSKTRRSDRVLLDWNCGTTTIRRRKRCSRMC